MTISLSPTYSEPRARSAHEKYASLLEGMFASVVLFVQSGAILPLLRHPGGEGTVRVNAGGFETPIYACAFAITIGLLYRFGAELKLLSREPTVWLLPAIALASTIWSTDPSQTLRSSVALIGSTLFGIYLALRFGAVGELQVVTAFLSLAVLVTIGAFLIDPAIVIEPGLHAGEWRGVFGHKNIFGRLMALTVMVSLLLMWHRPRLRAAATLLLPTSVGLLALSGSRTGFVVAAVAVVYLGARPVLRRASMPTWLTSLVLALALGTLASLAWAQRTNLAHADSGGETLTGRTLLWAASGVKILERPILGHGYSAFWAGKSGDYVDVWRMVNWSAPNAHNAFVDIGLDLGIVGMLALFWVLARSWSRTLRLQRNALLTPVEQVWPAAVVTFCIAAHFTEGQFVFNHAYWALFVSCAVIASPIPTPVRRPSEHTLTGADDGIAA